MNILEIERNLKLVKKNCFEFWHSCVLNLNLIHNWQILNKSNFQKSRYFLPPYSFNWLVIDKFCVLSVNYEIKKTRTKYQNRHRTQKAASTSLWRSLLRGKFCCKILQPSFRVLNLILRFALGNEIHEHATCSDLAWNLGKTLKDPWWVTIQNMLHIQDFFQTSLATKLHNHVNRAQGCRDPVQPKDDDRLSLSVLIFDPVGRFFPLFTSFVFVGVGEIV